MQELNIIIYQIGKFSFLKKHNIKTSESTIAINNSLEIIQLFNALDINRYKNSYSSSEDDYSDEDYINAAYESDSSQSGQDCECNGTFCTCSRKAINVITDKPKEILFDIIEHIDDEELRHKYLQELKRIVLSSDDGTSRPKPIIQPFSMTRVMAKFNRL